MAESSQRTRCRVATTCVQTSLSPPRKHFLGRSPRSREAIILEARPSSCTILGTILGTRFVTADSLKKKEPLPVFLAALSTRPPTACSRFRAGARLRYLANSCRPVPPPPTTLPPKRANPERSLRAGSVIDPTTVKISNPLSIKEIISPPENSGTDEYTYQLVSEVYTTNKRKYSATLSAQPKPPEPVRPALPDSISRPRVAIPRLKPRTPLRSARPEPAGCGQAPQRTSKGPEPPPPPPAEPALPDEAQRSIPPPSSNADKAPPPSGDIRPRASKEGSDQEAAAAVAPEVSRSERSERSESTDDYDCQSAESAVMGKRAGKNQPPLRSSVACLRCRRSKIKCTNEGQGAPCHTCIRSGASCLYPDAQSKISKRDGPAAIAERVEEEQRRAKLIHRGVLEGRRQKRKLGEEARSDNYETASKFANTVLSAGFLSEQIWNEVFEIYRLHFATELPFIHMPTLRERIAHKGSDQEEPGKSTENLNLVLLGILTLTARFHKNMVSYVVHFASSMEQKGRLQDINPKRDPDAASEFYADVLMRALGPLRTSMAVASVERVQAFLMLGLYEWGRARPNKGGLGAWMYVGVAIRMAQALGLCFEGMEPQGANSGAGRLPPAQSPATQSELVVRREVKRRTMFSCLILDRMLACGKERVSTIRSEDLHIKLPCSELSFDMAEESRTGFLRFGPAHWRAGDYQESLLSRFIRLVDLWGEISTYSFSGGRLQDHQNPPWEESQFRRLRLRLQEFLQTLARPFTFSRTNYHKHVSQHASGTYVALHMLSAVCQIMLHREYIPFIPMQCPGPVGPLDEPKFREEQPGFWRESAEQVFKAARQIVELIDVCKPGDRLPMSSLNLFAIWTAAFVGIYAWHFPHMDTEHHMLSRVITPDADITQSGPTSVALDAMKTLATTLNMASTYVAYFKDMDSYYTRVKHDYQQHLSETRRGAGNLGPLSRRDTSGGLEEWKRRNGKVVNNGTILGEDEDEEASNGTPNGVTLDDAMQAEGGGPSRTEPGLTSDGGSSVSASAVHSATFPTGSTVHSPPDAMEADADRSLGWARQAQLDREREMRQAFLSQQQQSQQQPQQPQQPQPQPQPQVSPVGGGGGMDQPRQLPFNQTYNSVDASLCSPGGVMGYVNMHQAMRWEEMTSGLEVFSHADAMGPGMWTVAARAGWSYDQPQPQAMTGISYYAPHF
ncbi:uncharacterized protein E0L32_007277 [Thyridium curvatum]|uniref:Zn(2)-C6 fungal-type domain-containing protein n=1 Tax=Thyridium curvatum TaxID=1093900 RepID=A0A507AZU8_9PEZI|nr:uncharacterized protein E0L32_007277 [Thyridium curvatum]TPX11974.1 hypothetical protein E0L32_007277 [Thyridium curvatum]